MKKITLVGIIIYTIGVLLAGVLYYTDIRRENAELRRRINEMIAQEEPSGGAETAVEEVPRQTGYVFPIAPEDYLMYTSAYGIRVSPILGVEMTHQGLDLTGTWRAQVVAIADGVVIDHYPPPGTRHPSGTSYRGHEVYGGMVHIRHDDGVESLYAHLSSTRVHIGKRVRAGEVIGRQGGTGRAAGEHVHLEIRVDGEPRNPLLYIPNPKGE